ncbi:hypothetical protein DV735_g707, partial [Chaetothyriales sp. CBS 134920]
MSDMWFPFDDIKIVLTRSDFLTDEQRESILESLQRYWDQHMPAQVGYAPAPQPTSYPPLPPPPTSPVRMAATDTGSGYRYWEDLHSHQQEALVEEDHRAQSLTAYVADNVSSQPILPRLLLNSTGP